jgi:hypothetical protein
MTNATKTAEITAEAAALFARLRANTDALFANAIPFVEFGRRNAKIHADARTRSLAVQVELSRLMRETV